MMIKGFKIESADPSEINVKNIIYGAFFYEILIIFKPVRAVLNITI